jgi:hypothetical protein
MPGSGVDFIHEQPSVPAHATPTLGPRSQRLEWDSAPLEGGLRPIPAAQYLRPPRQLLLPLFLTDNRGLGRKHAR